jgi:hypothetical protein
MKFVLKSFFKNYWILLVLVAIKLALQLIIVNPVYELHRDEFLHLDQANHLAAGYISVPPFTSWISLIINLLGGSVSLIRLFPALFGALTLIVIWLIIEQLDGGLLSKIVAGTVFIFSVYARINILFQPNSFDILAWTCFFYFLIRFIIDNRSRWLFIMMIFFVLGVYNKYTIFLLLFGVFTALLTTNLRQILVNWSFYLVLAIGIALLLPNLIWQYNHHFPVIRHMSILKETQLNHVDRIGFLKDQLMMLSFSFVLIFIALIGFFKYPPFGKFRVIGVAIMIIMTVFILLRAKNYYTLALVSTKNLSIIVHACYLL